MGTTIEPVQGEAGTHGGVSAAATPPQLWHADRFGVFRRQFSPQQQHDLLSEDLQAEMRVITILLAVFGAGLLLAIISLLLVVRL